MITYPRKCKHCDYESNNPSMYHCHNKTHDKIPEGTLCNNGCGQPAKFKNLRGIHACAKKQYDCPGYRKALSGRTKEYWQRPDIEERKEKTKEIFLECCAHNEVAQAKMLATVRGKFGHVTPADVKNYRSYARRIRQRGRKWGANQGYVLSTVTYHVDHKLSISDAWALGLTIEIVSHPANLQILTAEENIAKGASSCITLDELLEAIELASPASDGQV